MRTRRNIALVAAIATLTLTLVGCTGTPGSNNYGAPGQGTESQTDASPDAEGQDAPVQGADLATAVFAVSWQEAVDTAKANFDGNLTEIELSWNRDRYAYKVELVSATDEYDVRVDAMTGETFDESTEMIDANEVAKKQASTIDIDTVLPWKDALAAALAAQSGSVEEWSLDGTERGPKYVFDVRDSVGNDFDVSIDAVTGTVISVDE